MSGLPALLSLPSQIVSTPFGISYLLLSVIIMSPLFHLYFFVYLFLTLNFNFRSPRLYLTLTDMVSAEDPQTDTRTNNNNNTQTDSGYGSSSSSSSDLRRVSEEYSEARKEFNILQLSASETPPPQISVKIPSFFNPENNKSQPNLTEGVSQRPISTGTYSTLQLSLRYPALTLTPYSFSILN